VSERKLGEIIGVAEKAAIEKASDALLEAAVALTDVPAKDIDPLLGAVFMGWQQQIVELTVKMQKLVVE
jgi:hypothetical protein